MYIDTHCHVFSEYYDNIEGIVKKCKEKGVTKIIVSGCDMKSNMEVLELINKYDIIYGTIGFHPTELDDFKDEYFDFLINNINNKKIVGIGEILACEKVQESNKLLKSTVKIGSETRTILSGIAKFYSPEEMVGKKVVVVTNLAPRKMLKGKYVSEGMIVAAEDESGNVKLLTADGNVESGAIVG